MDTTTVQQLQRQIECLQLGFVDIRYKIVYCNRRCEGAVWYMVEDGQQIPIKQNALRGYADRLEVANLQRRGKETDKLQFTLNCGDIHYVLEAGVDSEFAQSLVYCLATLTPAQLKQPIIIQPEPGEDSAVLFARVRTNDYRRVFVDRAKLGSYETVLEQAIAHISTVTGNRPRSESSELATQSAHLSEDPDPVPSDSAPLESTSSDSAPSNSASLGPASLETVLPTSAPDPATRFQTIATWTGHKPSQLRAIAKQAKLPASSADMTPDQQIAMRDSIFLDWALKYPIWQQPDDCQAAYHNTIRTLSPNATDAKIWETWKHTITRQLAEQQPQPKKSLVTASN